MHVIPGLRLRANEEAEILGIDDAEMGEFAYDYVGLEAEINPKQEYAGAMGGPPIMGSAGASVVEKERATA
jgi:ammonium transporter, Amt family